MGSYLTTPDNVKAELYEFGTGVWTTVPDYPFGSAVAFYDMVYISQTSAYYVIGGQDGFILSTITLSKIGMFKNGAWSEAGQLNTARRVSFYSFFCFIITDLILRLIELNGQMAL